MIYSELTTEFSSSFGEARIDVGIAGGDQCSPQDPGAAGFQRHDGRYHAHSCAKFDQEFWRCGLRQR